MYALYNPSIHIPQNFLFTKRRGTLWEPDPLGLGPNFQQQSRLRPYTASRIVRQSDSPTASDSVRQRLTAVRQRSDSVRQA